MCVKEGYKEEGNANVEAAVRAGARQTSLRSVWASTRRQASCPAWPMMACTPCPLTMTSEAPALSKTCTGPATNSVRSQRMRQGVP